MTSLSYGPFISRNQALEQGLKWYFTGKPCKRGNVEIRYTSVKKCLCCAKAETESVKKVRHAQGSKPNPRMTHERFLSDMRKVHGDSIDTSKAVWAEGGKAKTTFICPRHGEWLAEATSVKAGAGCPTCGFERSAAAAASRRSPLSLYERRKASRESNPLFPLISCLRARVHQAVQQQRSYKKSKTRDLIGCSYEELRDHLASQFEPGMTWENHGVYGWHIDHIRPVASFDLTDEAQQRKCFHYTNLQPLWAKENLSKHDKWEPELVAA